MKTTENISLAGYAFTIETDAYEVLGDYIEEIRNSITDDSSRDEIVSDIEERIAELLNEKCINGSVVNILMINKIKHQIGDPSLLAQEEAETPSSDAAGKEIQQKKNPKRLYRNVEERIFGGVCAGLGSYFGIDKVVFRLIFLIAFLIGFFEFDEGLFGIAVIAYICLWIAMPAARTVEQKCEMKGKPMNLRNFGSKDFNIGKEARDLAKSPAGMTIRRAGGVFLGLLTLIIGIGGLLSSLFIPALQPIIGYEIADEIFDWGPLENSSLILTGLTTDSTFWVLAFMTVGIMFVWFLYNGIMLLFDLKAPSWKPGLVLFIAWMISVFALAAWVIKLSAEALTLMV